MGFPGRMSAEPSWVRAWTGGLPAVHVGDAAPMVSAARPPDLDLGE
ncbi:hypothetical protein AB0K16_31095 [Nonomuraea jabiensis]|uniref:Uncharacterized protein n=1 Tax=Nonomuraea jabiensis TaxID=882448 RepID=A0A7W9GFV8_9ACTN|nr:hypothetical protein [Nonomuraea jabiensis]